MIVLYGSNGSAFVARVRMQAYAKELPLEIRPAALGTPEFLRLNPLGKMPVLDHDGFIVPESQIICEYLEEVHPKPSLLGGTIQDRTRVRLIARTIDLHCDGVLSLLRAASDPSYKIDAGAERARLRKGLDAIESFLAEDGYAVAGELSLADCALVPWLFYANMLTKGGDDSLTRCRKLSRYAAFVADQALPRRIWGEMDEAFRAFMARWAAEKAAAAKTS